MSTNQGKLENLDLKKNSVKIDSDKNLNVLKRLEKDNEIFILF